MPESNDSPDDTEFAASTADEMREHAWQASLSAAESLDQSALMHRRTAEVHEKAADYAGIDRFRQRHREAAQRHRDAAQRHHEAAEQDKAMAEQLRRRAETE
jgi:hypothetical protein